MNLNLGICAYMKKPSECTQIKPWDQQTYLLRTIRYMYILSFVLYLRASDRRGCETAPSESLVQDPECHYPAPVQWTAPGTASILPTVASQRCRQHPLCSLIPRLSTNEATCTRTHFVGLAQRPSPPCTCTHKMEWVKPNLRLTVFLPLVFADQWNHTEVIRFNYIHGLSCLFP